MWAVLVLGACAAPGERAPVEDRGRDRPPCGDGSATAADREPRSGEAKGAQSSSGERRIVPRTRVWPRLLPARLLPDHSPWADHFVTYTVTPIDEEMARLRRAGFLASPPERTVRNDPGLRNGFVYVGPEYLEFCWVEREEEFRAAAREEPFYWVLRDQHRPYAIGFRVKDAAALHAKLEQRGYAMPDLLQAREDEAGGADPPRFAFGLFPADAHPGIHAFYLSDRELEEPRPLHVGENGVFLIVGVLFVSVEPRARVGAFADLLLDEGGSRDPWGFLHGPHAYLWISPRGFRQLSGESWPASPADYHELAAVIAITTDLDRTERFFERAELPYRRARMSLPLFGEHEGIFLHPNVREGFPMIVFEGDYTEWSRWRSAVSGAELELHERIP